jgi:hypothetical protein
MMYTQDNPNDPIRSHLDPDRDAKTTPGKWDLSSLPEPVHPPLNGAGSGESVEEVTGSSNSKLPQRYAEMHIDPFLDGDVPEGCWGRQI